MSDILCSAASWLGVDWDRCKGFTVAKKIDTPVGVGCGTLEEGRPVDKGEISFLDAVCDFLDIKEVEIPKDGTSLDGKKADHPIVCQDSDGDGYGIGPDCLAEDCDDAKADIYPGAKEICDGIDNDCDGNRNCLPQIPENCAEPYGACSCFVDPQVAKSEGAINFDPHSITVFTDPDTFSDIKTTYRLRFVDGAELKACINGMGWEDQYGIGAYADINFGQMGTDYVKEAFQKAQSGQVLLGIIDNYGRQLAAFILNGQDLQCLLVREGLAWENVFYYYKDKMDSLPPFPQVVFDASKIYGKPHFEYPHDYKQNKKPCQE